MTNGMSELLVIFIFLVFCSAVGYGIGYDIGWSNGWKESRDFVYEILNLMTDENIVYSVRAIAEKIKARERHE